MVKVVGLGVTSHSNGFQRRRFRPSRVSSLGAQYHIVRRDRADMSYDERLEMDFVALGFYDSGGRASYAVAGKRRRCRMTFSQRTSTL